MSKKLGKRLSKRLGQMSPNTAVVINLNRPGSLDFLMVVR